MLNDWHCVSLRLWGSALHGYNDGKWLQIALSPNKKNKCVSGNRSENLGRKGTHIFFFLLEKYNFMHCLSKCMKLFFSRKPEKILGFNSKFR